MQFDDSTSGNTPHKFLNCIVVFKVEFNLLKFSFIYFCIALVERCIRTTKMVMDISNTRGRAKPQ